MAILHLFLFRVTLALGVGLLASLLVARFGVWSPPWPLSVLDTFAMYGFTPFLGVAAVALLLRSRALFGVFLVSMLVFGQQFGREITAELGLSRRTIAAESETSPRLRVLTLNIQAPNDDPTLLVGVIREHQPDLVVLQEVTTAYAAALDLAISDAYPYSFSAGIEMEHEGAGTWSRLPLSDPNAFRLSEWGNELHRVRVTTAKGDVWLYNVHLPNPTDPANADDDPGLLKSAWSFHPGRRDSELDALVDQAASLDAPFIIAGDFNVSAGSHAYRELPSTWRDAYAVAAGGFGPTYPAPDHEHEGEPTPWLMRRFALLRIDYIWTSAQLYATRAWTQELVDTDHLAVVADLTFTD